MFDGMAVAYTEEILRVVQNTLPVHQTLRRGHAETHPPGSFHTPSLVTPSLTHAGLVPSFVGSFCLACMLAMGNASRLGNDVLVR